VYVLRWSPRLILLSRAPVDPKTGLSETGRIYEEKDGTKYNVVLNMSGTPHFP
jgi:hypothetical protein